MSVAASQGVGKLVTCAGELSPQTLHLYEYGVHWWIKMWKSGYQIGNGQLPGPTCEYGCAKSYQSLRGPTLGL